MLGSHFALTDQSAGSQTRTKDCFFAKYKDIDGSGQYGLTSAADVTNAKMDDIINKEFIQFVIDSEEYKEKKAEHVNVDLT